MAKNERRSALQPLTNEPTEEIKGITNPIFQDKAEVKEEIDRYTILLPKSKFKRIRLMAVERDVPIKAIFEEMLDEYLERHDV